MSIDKYCLKLAGDAGEYRVCSELGFYSVCEGNPVFKQEFFILTHSEMVEAQAERNHPGEQSTYGERVESVKRGADNVTDRNVEKHRPRWDKIVSCHNETIWLASGRKTPSKRSRPTIAYLPDDYTFAANALTAPLPVFANKPIDVLDHSGAKNVVNRTPWWKTGQSCR